MFWTTSYVPRRQSHLGCIIRIYIGLSRYFFSFSPCLKKVLWSDSLCPFLIILNFLNDLFLVRSSCSENPNFLVFFIFPSGPSASFVNCQLTSVDSACLNTQFWFTACRHRRLLHPPPPLSAAAASAAAASATAAASALLPTARHTQPPFALLSVVSVRRCCLCCRLHCYPRAAAVVIRSRRPQPPHSAVIVSHCCLHHHRRSSQCPTAVFHSCRCVSASSAAFGISPKIGKSYF